jgi:hypothetical protein
MNGEEKFLVRVSDDRFLKGADGSCIDVTDTPSFAQHLGYTAADQWCQRLRKRGFPHTVVTDRTGAVMTYERLKAELRAAQTKAADPLPTTRTELARIPAADVRRRYRSEPAFKQRYDELEGVQEQR